MPFDRSWVLLLADWLVRGDEHVAVDQPGEAAADERADPTQLPAKLPAATAGPKERAGFMDPPLKGPAARMLAPTMKPMAMGAMVPRDPFFGSAAVAYTVYTSAKEKARHGGAEQLGDPVEDSGEDGDVATDGEAEGDGGVQVTAGDVGGHGDTDEESERMGDGDGHQAGRV
ncbi:LOW QUALITY PROTEIN: hypothetical protein U9M48_033393 [Paspalum notatum var. saurae]|uniref:Uncharacterized protein n=1 Tax=Paspalum notatum var. saurae TaxID=547442 RepID=A0AAQ3UB82_PASNO